MSNTPKPLALIRITDAIDVMERPLKALQAVEQLTHAATSTATVDLGLLDRQVLGYLLTVIQLDFARVIQGVEQSIKGAQV